MYWFNKGNEKNRMRASGLDRSTCVNNSTEKEIMLWPVTYTATRIKRLIFAFGMTTSRYESAIKRQQKKGAKG
jgi:hypothetical protein